ncbi:MAG: hypothetical protein ACPH4G_03035 [Henriciella sp.]
MGLVLAHQPFLSGKSTGYDGAADTGHCILFACLNAAAARAGIVAVFSDAMSRRHGPFMISAGS